VRDLQNAYSEALECLAVAAEFRDNETGSHIRRIGEYAYFIGSKLGWDRDRLRTIRLAAPLHDVGKIGIPDQILLKQGTLTEAEFSLMQNHTKIGHRILSTSSSPVMVCAANIAFSHHERWDGTGYPRRLKGADIPIEGRIIALVDVYDALRSARPYKPAFSHEKACDIVINGDGRSGSGRHFDPAVLKVFARNTDQFAEIFERDSD
jgi:putative two-component system response regulator